MMLMARAISESDRPAARKSTAASMSRTGNCYDNAVMESFWGTLKTELIYQEKYDTREQAKSSIFEYIEVFYNGERRHSSIEYFSPIQFESLTRQTAAA